MSGRLGHARHLRHGSSQRLRLVVAAAAILVVSASAGAALAYFGAHGSGSASAVTGTAASVSIDSVTEGSLPNVKLIPGGTADLLVQITNPNSTPVTIVGYGPDGPAVATNAPGCTTTGVSVETVTGATISVPPGSKTITLPGAAHMDASSGSACQGATFQIPVSLTLQQ